MNKSGVTLNHRRESRISNLILRHIFQGVRDKGPTWLYDRDREVEDEDKREGFIAACRFVSLNIDSKMDAAITPTEEGGECKTWMRQIEATNSDCRYTCEKVNYYRCLLIDSEEGRQ